ncbi:MAG: flagellar M-ring protein FliF [Hyphomicrobiales bacterium]|nr:flagellar M-ring protein FliF [Hyphomicrobiales bacterium]
MAALIKMFGSLGAARLAVLAGATLASVWFLAWVMMRLGEPDYALLYGDLEMGDSAEIIAQLDASATPYRLEGNGSVILIPRDAVARTRVSLAEQGLPEGGSLGYEIFDTVDTFGTSNFIQNINHIRALEGELSRTIRTIKSVKNARVHLVLPKRDLFKRQQQKPTASVLLQIKGGGSLAPSQVLAIQNLVASAVPGLVSNQVSIVDGNGELLTDTPENGADGATLTSSKAERRRLDFESHLARTIETLLGNVVGPGKVRAEVSADMNFDRINTTEEKFDPDGQVVRSTRTTEEEGANQNKDDAPPVTVATSLPDTSGLGNDFTSSSSNESRIEEVTNYEISKKIINHVREVGVVNRLSIAVLVDGVYTQDTNGEAVYEPRPAAELEKLTTLVRSAVGFDEERGDTVEVISMRFTQRDEAVEEESSDLFLGLTKDDLFRIAEYVGLIGLSLLVLLLVIRPILSKALNFTPEPRLPAQAALAAAASAQPTAALSGPDGQMQPQLIAADKGSMIEESIDLRQVEGRLTASSAKRVGEIIEKHPEETLGIVRSWLHSED